MTGVATAQTRTKNRRCEVVPRDCEGGGATPCTYLVKVQKLIGRELRAGLPSMTTFALGLTAAGPSLLAQLGAGDGGPRSKPVSA